MLRMIWFGSLVSGARLVGTQLGGDIGRVLALDGRVACKRVAASGRAVAGRASHGLLLGISRAVQLLSELDLDGSASPPRAVWPEYNAARSCNVLVAEAGRHRRHERILPDAITERLELSDDVVLVLAECSATRGWRCCRRCRDKRCTGSTSPARLPSCRQRAPAHSIRSAAAQISVAASLAVMKPPGHEASGPGFSERPIFAGRLGGELYTTAPATHAAHQG